MPGLVAMGAGRVFAYAFGALTALFASSIYHSSSTSLDIYSPDYSPRTYHPRYIHNPPASVIPAVTMTATPYQGLPDSKVYENSYVAQSHINGSTPDTDTSSAQNDPAVNDLDAQDLALTRAETLGSELPRVEQVDRGSLWFSWDRVVLYPVMVCLMYRLLKLSVVEQTRNDADNVGGRIANKSKLGRHRQGTDANADLTMRSALNKANNSQCSTESVSVAVQTQPESVSDLGYMQFAYVMMENSALSEALLHANTTKRALEDSNRGLESEKLKLSAKIDDQEESLNEYKEKYSEFEKATLQISTKQNSRVGILEAKLRAETQALRAANAEEMRIMQIKIDDTRAEGAVELEKMQYLNARLQRDVASLEKQVAEKTAVSQYAERIFNEANKENADLKLHIDQLLSYREEARKMKELNNELQKDVFDLEKQVAQKTAVLELREQIFNSVSKENSDLKLQTGQLLGTNQELQKFQERNSKWQKKVHEVKNQVAKKNAMLEYTKKIASSAQKEACDLKSKISQLQESQQTLSAKHDAAETSLLSQHRVQRGQWLYVPFQPPTNTNSDPSMNSNTGMKARLESHKHNDCDTDHGTRKSEEGDDEVIANADAAGLESTTEEVVDKVDTNVEETTPKETTEEATVNDVESLAETYVAADQSPYKGVNDEYRVVVDEKAIDTEGNSPENAASEEPVKVEAVDESEAADKHEAACTESHQETVAEAELAHKEFVAPQEEVESETPPKPKTADPIREAGEKGFGQTKVSSEGAIDRGCLHQDFANAKFVTHDLGDRSEEVDYDEFSDTEIAEQNTGLEKNDVLQMEVTQCDDSTVAATGSMMEVEAKILVGNVGDFPHDTAMGCQGEEINSMQYRGENNGA